MRRIAAVAALALGLAGCAALDAEPAAVAAASEVRPLAWTGTARVYAGDRVLALGVSTRVIPFLSARSETWLLEQGPSSKRAMIIEPDAGWLERGGKREPMPAAMLAHERQQFAIYGLMQIAISKRLARAGGWSPDVPETEFIFDPAGRLVEARNAVVDPAGGAALIPQLFRFSGQIDGKGLAWPRRFEILQNGLPYFTLELESFSAGAP